MAPRSADLEVFADPRHLPLRNFAALADTRNRAAGMSLRAGALTGAALVRINGPISLSRITFRA